MSSGSSQHFFPNFSDLDPGIVQQLFRFLRALRISIDNQVPLTDGKACIAIGKVSSYLQHPLSIWNGE